ncbi:FMN-binding protein [Sulfurimonas sp.]|uniref:FMN-binding protein n=1 Tax=Sulfurimonas sp. TaxID=2022749 RepID=UPI0025D130C5|nr:FMN-binding protein [Sulfurimonas sp.]
MNKITLLLLLSFSLGTAQNLADPVAITGRTFGMKSIETKNINLNDAQIGQLSTASKQKIDTKLYRVFIAKNGSKVAGYGVLVNKKIRTKNAVTLYLITTDKKIKSIEIVAFNEPAEYLPSKTWLELFDNKSESNPLMLNQDIPAKTGATLSARTITDGARVALALLKITKL